MKKLFVSLLLSALALSVSYGELDEKGKRVYENIAESDERGDYTQNILDPFVATSSLVLDAKSYKGEYFVGEVFSVEIVAKTTEKTDFEFELSFNKNDSLAFLNPNPKWQRNYAHLAAQELEVRHFKSDFFDDKNLVMIVELWAKGANLKNFKLNNEKIIQQRVDGLRGDFNESSAFYSAVFPPNVSQISFSYFNTTTQKLESVSLKVEVSDEKISTQTDLNPQDNSLDFYKRLFLWVIAFICGVLFVVKRHYAFLIAAFIAFLMSFLVGESNDTQKGILKANSKATLLPTAQSTHFYTSERDEEVEILGERKNFIKVLLNDGKIGWVSREAVQKD